MSTGNMPTERAYELFGSKQFGLLRESDLIDFLPDGFMIARLSKVPDQSRWRLYCDKTKTYVPDAEAPNVRTLLINFYRREFT